MIIAVMRNLQPITHQGQLVAIVIAGQAIIDDTLTPPAHRHVQAMCLYALELAQQGRPHSYTDTDAEQYARAALATS